MRVVEPKDRLLVEPCPAETSFVRSFPGMNDIKIYRNKRSRHFVVFRKGGFWFEVGRSFGSAEIDRIRKALTGASMDRSREAILGVLKEMNSQSERREFFDGVRNEMNRRIGKDSWIKNSVSVVISRP